MADPYDLDLIRRSAFGAIDLSRPIAALETGHLPTEVDVGKLLAGSAAKLYRTNVSGPGIDFAWDLEQPLSPTVQPQRFDVIFCLHVMEHVRRPWLACANLEAALADDGLLVWSTPWVHRLHGYPDDYWRFSPSAIRSLFNEIDWLTTWCVLRGSTARQAIPIEDGFINARLRISDPSCIGKSMPAVVVAENWGEAGMSPYAKGVVRTHAKFMQSQSIDYMPYSGFFFVGRKRPRGADN